MDVMPLQRGFTEAKAVVVEHHPEGEFESLLKAFIEFGTSRIGIMRRFFDHLFEEGFMGAHRLVWALSVPYRYPKLRKSLLTMIMERGHV